MNGLAEARERDRHDPLRRFRGKFHLPRAAYFCGNSLGLQPKATAGAVQDELEDWKRLGVEGHLHARHPWLPYHELVTAPMARVVGAKPGEVVVMNSLTTNLHLLLVSFYRPTKARHKIILEKGAFPSDRYALASQARFHGFDPERTLMIAPFALPEFGQPWPGAPLGFAHGQGFPVPSPKQKDVTPEPPAQFPYRRNFQGRSLNWNGPLQDCPASNEPE